MLQAAPTSPEVHMHIDRCGACMLGGVGMGLHQVSAGVVGHHVAQRERLPTWQQDGAVIYEVAASHLLTHKHLKLVEIDGARVIPVHQRYQLVNCAPIR